MPGALLTDRAIVDAAELLDAGDSAGAKSLLEAVIATRPHDSQPLFLLALSEFRLGNTAAALDLFGRVLRRDKAHYWALYYRGLIYERTGHPWRARRTYRRVLAIVPEFQSATSGLGRVSELNARRRRHKPTRSTKVVPLRSLRTRPKAPADTLAANLERNAAALQNLGSSPARSVWQGRRRSTSFTVYVLGASLVAILLLILSVAMPDIAIAAIPIAALTLASVRMRGRSWSYRIDETKITMEFGVVYRRIINIWMYEVENVVLTQNLVQRMMRTATLALEVEDRNRGLVFPSGRPRPYRLRGLSSKDEMQQLWEYVRDRSILERRAMKNIWV